METINRPQTATATITAAIKTATRRRAKWDKPVSRKFYLSIKGQVESAGKYCKQIDVAKVMTALHEYIHGYVYAKPLNDVEKVEVKLLVHHNKKARERSQRAREAAARRRQAKENAAQLAPTPAMPATVMENTASGQTSISTDTSTRGNSPKEVYTDIAVPSETVRVQRRTAAAARRRLKHLKRIARRHKHAT